MITTEKLPENLGGKYVQVEWDIKERFDSAGDGHVYMHFADGITVEDEEYKFEGSAIVCDGETIEIEDVEFIGKTK
jgi:hypothetical protein